jgi:hypothetical protein
MSGSLANRIAKLEPRAIPHLIPHICIVPYGSSAVEAIAAFRQLHGRNLRACHALIIVPERITTPEQQAEFASCFRARQNRLVTEARSSRFKEPLTG